MSFLNGGSHPKKIRGLKFFLLSTLAVGAFASLITEPSIPYVVCRS